MSDNIVPIPHRHRRRDFLTIGAAAAAVVAGIGPVRAATSGDDAELFAMIAEEDRLRDIVDALEARAWKLVDAHEIRPEVFRLIEEHRLPEPIAAVWAESARHETAAEEIANRIEATVPKTIAGAIALIKYWGADDSTVVENALAGLREIAAKGGAA
jgi:hypothetical protein